MEWYVLQLNSIEWKSKAWHGLGRIELGNVILAQLEMDCLGLGAVGLGDVQ